MDDSINNTFLICIYQVTGGEETLISRLYFDMDEIMHSNLSHIVDNGLVVP